MKYLRNVNPFKSIKLVDMITHGGRKIASKALINTDKNEIRFFSFAANEDISKEIYEMESIFIVIDGTLKVNYNENDEVIVNEGEMVALESDIPYGIEALTDCKVMNILVR